MNVLVLTMGGSGTRVGETVPKQYLELNNVPIFGYILEKYNRLNCIDKIVIVSNINYIEYVNKWIDILDSNKTVGVVPGGQNRSSSIKNALDFISTFANSEDIVLFHDATHPYVDEEGTEKVIEAIKKYGGATLAAYNYDTVYSKDKDDFLSSVVQRNDIVAGASPEGFKFGIIYNIYKNATEEQLESMTSAGAIALANNIDMQVIECGYLNLKITYKKDLVLLEKLLTTYFFKDFNYEKYKIKKFK